MSDAKYRDLLTKSGLLKLRATSLLAFGDAASRFEAAVLLHDAVRLEDKAFSLLSNPDAVSKLRHAVERWACLIDGLDPVNAGAAWDDVKIFSKGVDRNTRWALRARIEPRWVAMSRAFEKAIKNAPVLFPAGRFSMFIAPQDNERQARARVEIARLLDAYPGVGLFWHGRYDIDTYRGMYLGHKSRSSTPCGCCSEIRASRNRGLSNRTSESIRPVAPNHVVQARFLSG